MMINRGAVLLRFKEPMVEWVNSSHPKEAGDEKISIEELNADRTIYLVDDRDAEEIEEWLALNFNQLFETELEDWSEDEDSWPQDRSFETFNSFFTVECHGLIIDTVGQPIVTMDESIELEESE
ncbi:MAG: hypothetical protein OCC45_11635 [Desulfotalea sp.]